MRQGSHPFSCSTEACLALQQSLHLIRQPWGQELGHGAFIGAGGGVRGSPPLAASETFLLLPVLSPRIFIAKLFNVSM